MLKFFESVAGFFGFGRHYVATAGIDLLSPSSVVADWEDALRRIAQWRLTRGALARKVYIPFRVPPRAPALVREVHDLVGKELLKGGLPGALQGLRIETYMTNEQGDCLFDVIIKPDGTVERHVEREA